MQCPLQQIMRSSCQQRDFQQQQQQVVSSSAMLYACGAWNLLSTETKYILIHPCEPSSTKLECASLQLEYSTVQKANTIPHARSCPRQLHDNFRLQVTPSCCLPIPQIGIPCMRMLECAAHGQLERTASSNAQAGQRPNRPQYTQEGPHLARHHPPAGTQSA